MANEMAETTKAENLAEEEFAQAQDSNTPTTPISPVSPNVQEQGTQQQQPQQQQQQQQQKAKRKHRRGRPKSKYANKPYKKTNWRFQVPRYNYNSGGGGGGGGGSGGNSGGAARAKLVRSRSLVPYNTNKFLMEEHLADIPSALLTPSGRTRDSSFSVDSEDNYFYSLPEDEEEFLTKEFANVYEKARVERLENLSKQQLIEECLQIEDRYSTDQGTQRQQQLNVQRISGEFLSKIRALEEKIRELSRENYNLRCQLMRSAALAAAAAASPPSAAAPTGAACEPTPMESSSEDSESDSSSSSTTSSSSGGEAIGQHNNDRLRRRRSCSSHSSLNEYNGHLDDQRANMAANAQEDINEENANENYDDEQQQQQQQQQQLEAGMDCECEESTTTTSNAMNQNKPNEVVLPNAQLTSSPASELNVPNTNVGEG